jgi:hypothetical protein
LVNHDVAEVESEVVEFFVDFAKLGKEVADLLSELFVFSLDVNCLFSGFDDKKNEENDGKDHQDSGVGEVVHDKRLAHAKIAKLVEGGISDIGKAFFLIDHLVEAHGILKGQYGGKSLGPILILVDEE